MRSISKDGFSNCARRACARASATCIAQRLEHHVEVRSRSRMERNWTTRSAPTGMATATASPTTRRRLRLRSSCLRESMAESGRVATAYHSADVPAWRLRARSRHRPSQTVCNSACKPPAAGRGTPRRCRALAAGVGLAPAVRRTGQETPTMVSIRFHGRGGQGAVIASKLLAHAMFHEGWEVQAFPSFGAERTGAPVAAFLRADHQPITLHCQIYAPDGVVVLDPLLHAGARRLSRGLAPGGWLLVNAAAVPGRTCPCRRASVSSPATPRRSPSAHGLGTRTRPIVNTAVIGALAGVHAPRVDRRGGDCDSRPRAGARRAPTRRRPGPAFDARSARRPRSSHDAPTPAHARS